MHSQVRIPQFQPKEGVGVLRPKVLAVSIAVAYGLPRPPVIVHILKETAEGLRSVPRYLRSAIQDILKKGE